MKHVMILVEDEPQTNAAFTKNYGNQFDVWSATNREDGFTLIAAALKQSIKPVFLIDSKLPESEKSGEQLIRMIKSRPEFDGSLILAIGTEWEEWMSESDLNVTHIEVKSPRAIDEAIEKHFSKGVGDVVGH